MHKILLLCSVRHSVGAHSVYISPEDLPQTLLRDIGRNYPPESGIKIARKPGSYTGGANLFGNGHSQLQQKLIYGHPHAQVLSSVLNIAGLGPRVFDVAELLAGTNVWVIQLVEHVPLATGSEQEATRCILGICELADSGEIEVVAPNGLRHPDFLPPTFSGNIRWTKSGRALYVDTQNFRLLNHERYLRGLARAAVHDSHFGDESISLGGRYLYQSIPGLSEISKRSTNTRIDTIDGLFKEADVDLRDRLVLDVGCNIGMMLAEYLRRGAAWCHGWDQESTIHHTHRLLLAIGCTRFSLTGGHITSSCQLQNDIPPFLGHLLKGSFMSYLAMHRHIGALRCLALIPWRTLLIEGHEFERLDDISGVAATLCGGGELRLMAQAEYVDGTSAVRPIALFARG